MIADRTGVFISIPRDTQESYALWRGSNSSLHVRTERPTPDLSRADSPVFFFDGNETSRISTVAIVQERWPDFTAFLQSWHISGMTMSRCRSWWAPGHINWRLQKGAKRAEADVPARTAVTGLG
jgi:hypothetical protein